MRCAHPHYALDLGINKETGKHILKFVGFRVDLSSYKQLTERYGKDSVLALPCGKCLPCRLNHAKEWAVRCVLESLDYENNYFLTLTYDDDHLPEDGRLHRSDVQKFLKRFRHHFGNVRYFGCGEYGSKNKRPHYHLILFGADIPDLKAIGSNLFESKKLAEIWPFGFHYIGDVSYASCNYVAKYTTKKIFGDDSSDEFLMCSTNPGIGYSWIRQHLQKVLDYDAVYGSFGNRKVAKMPRYFEKIAEVLDNSKFMKLKESRLDKSNAMTINEMLIHGIENVEQLLEYKENILIGDYCSQKQGKRL
jgi:hypothetical protein